MDKTDELMAEVERLRELVRRLREEKDRQVREVCEEKDRALELVGQMRKQIEDADALIESWIEAFETEQDDSGVPARTNETLAHGKTLIKAAKGLEALRDATH
jgi:hypothetical protein